MRKVILLGSLIICLVFPVTVLSTPSTIMVGHVINITVLNHSELSQSVVVREDGTTDYPLLSNIPIDGMSVAELSTFLMPIFTRYVERPLFFVNISDYRLLNIRVLGQVERPGPKVVRSPIGLQGVLAQSGGKNEEADLTNITILRHENNVSETIKVNLLTMVGDSSAYDDYEIRNGDVIIVPMYTFSSYVRVMGEVRLPGIYIPTRNETVLDMIYQAGGYSFGADDKVITHISYRDNKYSSQDINIRKLLKSGKTNQIPDIQPGDIIIVHRRQTWASFSFWAQTLRDVALLLSSIVLIQRL